MYDKETSLSFLWLNVRKKMTLDNSKKELLSKEVEHIDITSFDARSIIKSMEKMSFTSRDTANAAKYF